MVFIDLFWLCLCLPGYALARRCWPSVHEAGLLAVIASSVLGTFLVLSPVSMLCYLAGVPAAVFTGAFVAAVLAGLAYCVRVRAHRTLFAGLRGESLVAWLALAALLWLQLRIGAYFSGDATFHLGRIRVLLEHGFTNRDIYLAEYHFQHIYHTNLLYPMYAAASQLTGQTYLAAWFHSQAFAKLLVAAGHYVLGYAVTQRKLPAWLVALSVITANAGESYTTYPNTVAVGWLLPMQLAAAFTLLTRAGRPRHAVVLAACSFVTAQVHALYAVYAGLAMGPALAVLALTPWTRGRRKLVAWGLAGALAAVPFLLVSQFAFRPKGPRSADEDAQPTAAAASSREPAGARWFWGAEGIARAQDEPSNRQLQPKSRVPAVADSVSANREANAIQSSPSSPTEASRPSKRAQWPSARPRDDGRTRLREAQPSSPIGRALDASTQVGTPPSATPSSLQIAPAPPAAPSVSGADSALPGPRTPAPAPDGATRPAPPAAPLPAASELADPPKWLPEVDKGKPIVPSPAVALGGGHLEKGLELDSRAVQVWMAPEKMGGKGFVSLGFAGFAIALLAAMGRRRSWEREQAWDRERALPLLAAAIGTASLGVILFWPPATTFAVALLNQPFTVARLSTVLSSLLILGVAVGLSALVEVMTHAARRRWVSVVLEALAVLLVVGAATRLTGHAPMFFHEVVDAALRPREVRYAVLDMLEARREMLKRVVPPGTTVLTTARFARSVVMLCDCYVIIADRGHTYLSFARERRDQLLLLNGPNTPWAERAELLRRYRLKLVVFESRHLARLYRWSHAHGRVIGAAAGLEVVELREP